MRGVVDAVLGLRRRTARLEAATSLPARSDGLPLLCARLADRAFALGIAGHQAPASRSDHCAPSGVSVTSTPRLRESVANLVGHRPVLVPGLGPSIQIGAHQHVERRHRRRVVGGIDPVGRHRVGAEDIHHRADLPGDDDGDVTVTILQRRVARPDRVVDDGEPGGYAQVVVEGRRELGGHLADRHRRDPRVDAADE